MIQWSHNTQVLGFAIFLFTLIFFMQLGLTDILIKFALLLQTYPIPTDIQSLQCTTSNVYITCYSWPMTQLSSGRLANVFTLLMTELTYKKGNK